MKRTHIIIMVFIALAALVLAGVMAFAIADRMADGAEEATTVDSELLPLPVTQAPTSETPPTIPDSWDTGHTIPATSEPTETTREAAPEPEPTAAGEVGTLGEPSVVPAEEMESANKFLVLLNKDNKMAKEYVPHLEEAVDGVYLEAEAAEAYARMYADAFEQGLTLTPMSGYRSYDRQETNYENLAAEFAAQGYTKQEAYALAAREILPPGCSEHNYGLAMDIGWIAQSFAESAEYRWLVNNAADYGFIERYTQEKQSITGVIPEPWHWRYVGSAETAHAIQDSGLCLEEFLNRQ